MKNKHNRKNGQRGGYHQFHKPAPKEEKDFGDFEELKEESSGDVKNPQQNNQPQGFARIRLPRPNQIIGVIEQRLGGARMMVSCTDKIPRNCRVPGRLKRELWLRPGDVVLIELWEFDKNKGDVIYKYHPASIEWLKKNGYLKSEASEF